MEERATPGKHRGRSVRRGARWKRFARALVHALLAPVALLLLWGLRLTSLRAGVAVVYHGVAEHAGDPNREFVPAISATLFERQVRHARRHYRLVTARELHAAIATRRRGERFPVALTFDDDLRCHVAVTLPVLRRAGVTGTFFLTGVSLEGPFSFWWERLDRALQRGASLAVIVGDASGSEPHRDDVAVALRRLSPTARAEFESRLADAAGPDPPDSGLRVADVRELAREGMEIGFHTRGHQNLVTLDDASLSAAMHEGRAALEAAAGEPIQTIGYPYGFANDSVADAARAAGYLAGFTIESGAVTESDDPLLTRRVGPAFSSHRRFASQLPLVLLSARELRVRRRGGSNQ
jgi:peptidoglycan/xylan/chitin deacetylase (PgdA/CDA1 family)